MAPRLVKQASLAALLANWGRYEGVGRLPVQMQSELGPEHAKNHPLSGIIARLNNGDPVDATNAAIEIVLVFRLPLLEQILQNRPTGECAEIEVDAPDASLVRAFDGKTIAEWAAARDEHEKKWLGTLTKQHVEGGGPLVTIAGSM